MKKKTNLFEGKLDRNEVVESFLKLYSEPKFKKDLDFSTLENITHNYINNTLGPLQVDFIYSIRTKKNVLIYIPILVESREDEPIDDPLVRLFNTSQVILQKIKLEMPYFKGLPVVYPVFWYLKHNNYMGPTSLNELRKDMPLYLMKYQQNFRFFVFNEYEQTKDLRAELDKLSPVIEEVVVIENNKEDDFFHDEPMVDGTDDSGEPILNQGFFDMLAELTEKIKEGKVKVRVKEFIKNKEEMPNKPLDLAFGAREKNFSNQKIQDKELSADGLKLKRELDLYLRLYGSGDFSYKEAQIRIESCLGRGHDELVSRYLNDLLDLNINSDT